MAIREHRTRVDVARAAGVGRRYVIQLWIHVPDLAQVAHGLSCQQTALHRQTVSRARGYVEQEAVVVLIPRTEVLGLGEVVVDLPELRRHDVVETGDSVATAVR